jgi:hypothetical protein
MIALEVVRGGVVILNCDPSVVFRSPLFPPSVCFVVMSLTVAIVFMYTLSVVVVGVMLTVVLSTWGGMFIVVVLVWTVVLLGLSVPPFGIGFTFVLSVSVTFLIPCAFVYD